MKKALSQAIAAATLVGAAGIAQATSVNHAGQGQALLYPYYSVENTTDGGSNNYTVIHLTNTKNEFKAVKVRFREYQDSKDVLDFNLYLSPEDMWTGAVFMGEDGKPRLMTNDTSCISNYPDGLANVEGGQEFVRPANAEKGHIEIIEMATWTADTVDQFGDVTAQGTASAEHVDKDGAVTVAEAIEHVDVLDADGNLVGREPGNCKAIHDSWNQTGKWGGIYVKYALDDANPNPFEDTSLGAKPTGGLYGNAYVINPDQAWASSFAPVALNDLYTPGMPAAENNHHAPKFELPSLHGPNPALNQVGGNALAGHIVLANNGSQPVATIAAAMDKTNFQSDYTLVGDSQASTELVLTFPMKYAGFPAVGGKSHLGAVFYDREEGRQVAKLEDFQLSPWTPEQAALPQNFLDHEVNVVHIGTKDDRNDIGKATLNLNAPFAEGWVDIQLQDADRAPATAPVIGFTSTVLKNGVVGATGAVNSYALNFPLKSK